MSPSVYPILLRWSEQNASCFGFSERLICFVQSKTLCRYGCMYFLTALILVCADVMVMSSTWDMTGSLDGVKSAV